MPKRAAKFRKLARCEIRYFEFNMEWNVKTKWGSGGISLNAE